MTSEAFCLSCYVFDVVFAVVFDGVRNAVFDVVCDGV
jgi:hypothetical protein